MARGDRYDIVWFWKQNDSGLYGRRQDMWIRHLAASPRVRRIVHFDRPLTPGELFADVRLERHPLRRHANLVLLQTLPRLVSWPLGRKVSRHSYLYARDAPAPRRRLLARVRGAQRHHVYVRRVLERCGVGGERTVFWVYPRFLAFPELVARFQPPLVVADCLDDQRAWPGASQRHVARTDANYREVLAGADLVLTNCEGMRAALAEHRSDVRVLPSGWELAGRARACPAELRALPRPILGYAGSLSARLDVELLERLATRHPEWSLVLIGSAHGGSDVSRIAALPNVHRLGVRRYPRVRDYVRHFDVALLPHRDDALTRSMAPLKLGVYCSEGVPVVSTRVANLGPLEGVIDVAANAEEFLALVERALASPEAPERRARRLRILAAGTWERRTEELLALLDAAWERRALGPRAQREASDRA
jgi:hypothetical protein